MLISAFFCTSTDPEKSRLCKICGAAPLPQIKILTKNHEFVRILVRIVFSIECLSRSTAFEAFRFQSNNFKCKFCELRSAPFWFSLFDPPYALVSHGYGRVVVRVALLQFSQF